STLTSDPTMTRKELSAAFPTRTGRECARLRTRKKRGREDIPAYHSPDKRAAEIAPDGDYAIPHIEPPRYRDMLSHHGNRVSLEEMRDSELGGGEDDWADEY